MKTLWTGTKYQTMHPTASISLAFLLGLALSQTNIAASEPGYLDFDNLPETNFSCEGKVIGGYYADVETGCQMFHVCTIGQKGEITDIKFLCLNGTVFDQETRVCERIDEVDCAKSESFFGLNLELYGNNPAALGIAPEEPDCGDECSTEYSAEADTTIIPSSTTTTSTTTTTPAPVPTVSSSTVPPPPPHRPLDFATSSPQTVAALLSLRNVYSRPTPDEEDFSSPDDPGFGFGERPKPSDYVHGYPRREEPQQQHFRYFERSSTPAPFSVRDDAIPQAAVSVVTSTSSSTSVRTSRIKPFPTGYDDYRESDVASDPFFRDVPRLRKSRKRRSASEKTKFLENLLNSIDIVQEEREKLIRFFENTEPEMEKDVKEMDIDRFLSVLQEKIGSMDLNSDNMTEEEYDIGEVEGTRLAEDAVDTDIPICFDEKKTERPRTKRQTSRGKTDKSKTETSRRGQPNAQARNSTREVVKPVTELVDEGEFTTVEYRRPTTKTSPDPGRWTQEPQSRRLQTRFDSYRESTTTQRGVNSGRRTGLRSGVQRFPKNLSTVRYRNLTPRSDTKKVVPVYENPEPQSAEARSPEPARVSAGRNRTEPARISAGRNRTETTRGGPRRRGPPRSRNPTSAATPTTVPPETTTLSDLKPDPDFSCEDKVKGGLYADVYSGCRGFFICSQGKVDEPLLKTHFWCGPATKFNQRSRTCQADRLVECSAATRYYHLNDDLNIPETEDILLGNFEPVKITT